MMLPGFPHAAPLDGLVGGLMIGASAAILLLGIGRIAGVSGVAAKAMGLGGSGMGRGSAWLFVLGLPLGALLVTMVRGGGIPHFANPVSLAVAGLLVGIGTRIGSGCTSGHGVCGLSRFSARSIVATLVFMAFGIATVAAMNAFGWEPLR